MSNGKASSTWFDRFIKASPLGVLYSGQSYVAPSPSNHVADTTQSGTYSTDAAAIVAHINSIRDCLVAQGLMKSS